MMPIEDELNLTQITVPTNLVNAAIRQGIADGAAKRRRRRAHRVALAAAVVLVGVATFTPATIQAGGIVPAYKQLLDKHTNAEHFDPTARMLLGQLDDVSHYHQLDVPAQTVNGIKVQPLGTMATAGLVAVIVDYTGPGIDPTAFDDVHMYLDHTTRTFDIKRADGQPVGDVSHDAYKVGLGHYRQLFAFYPKVLADVNIGKFSLSFIRINNQPAKLEFADLTLPHLSVKTTQATQRKTLAVPNGQATVKLTKLRATPESLVIDYQTQFADLPAKQAKVYADASWISHVDVVQNGHVLGQMNMAIGGMALAHKTQAGVTTGNFQSVFATTYQTRTADALPIPKGAQLRLHQELPGHDGRLQVATYTVDADQVLIR